MFFLSAGTGSWRLRLAVVPIAPVQVGGVQVQLEMTGDAVGTITSGASGLEVQLPLQVRVTAATQPPTDATVGLQFTSGELTIGKGKKATTVSGVALDAASGFLQIVGVGTSPEAIPGLGGKAFYVILSGAISDLPQSISGP